MTQDQQIIQNLQTELAAKIVEIDQLKDRLKNQEPLISKDVAVKHLTEMIELKDARIAAQDLTIKGQSDIIDTYKKQVNRMIEQINGFYERVEKAEESVKYEYSKNRVLKASCFLLTFTVIAITIIHFNS